MSHPATGPSVVVVVPTYNERPNLAGLIDGILGLGHDFRVIIVDDNSPDGTGSLADELAAEHPGRIEVIHRPRKSGLGSAYVAGFSRALEMQPDLVAQMDADHSHNPASLPALIQATREYDLIIGSRYVPGGETRGWPLWRQLLSRMGGQYARAVLGVPIADLTGGYKVWRRPLLEQISLADLRSDGYAFTIEATWRALQCGARATEVPITFHDRVAGASKLSRRIVGEAALLVWRLRWEARSRTVGSTVRVREQADR